MTIAKKGEKVIITSFGETNSSNFTLNKPYVLAEDLNEKNGFIVEEDDNKHYRNGWTDTAPFDLKMTFEKASFIVTRDDLKRLNDAFVDDNFLIQAIIAAKLGPFDNTCNLDISIIKYMSFMATAEQLAVINRIFPSIKRKVTKNVTLYVNVYKDKESYFPHVTLEKAQEEVKKDAIAVGVKLSGTYEIEE